VCRPGPGGTSGTLGLSVDDDVAGTVAQHGPEQMLGVGERGTGVWTCCLFAFGRHACVHGGAWPAAAGPRLGPRAPRRARGARAQVVFATETLAAGINMPARTTVLSTISRRRNAGHTPLQHNELLQMAGRAGRRGYDTAGALLALLRTPAATCEHAGLRRDRVAATACSGCVSTRSISARAPRSLRRAGGVVMSTEGCRRWRRAPPRRWQRAPAAGQTARCASCRVSSPAGERAGPARGARRAAQRVAAGPPAGARLLTSCDSGSWGSTWPPAGTHARHAPAPEPRRPARA
jgi:hypothetical protein